MAILEFWMAVIYLPVILTVKSRCYYMNVLRDTSKRRCGFNSKGIIYISIRKSGVELQ